MYSTPIIEMNYNDGKNKYYMKRDDLFPVSFGGNKARKALLFFKDIMEKKANCIVTYGASSSNHSRVISNIAASKGIPCYIITPLESSYTTTNKKLVEIFGANVIQCPISEVKNTIDQKMHELRLEGYNPYFIQGGGHGNLGTQAYVYAYEEIVNYEKKNQVNFDYIFHTSGTGTTQAGLICGKYLHKSDTQIIGISNARRNPYGGKVILDSVNKYFKSKEILPITQKEIKFIDDYVLEGYADYNEPIIKTIKEVLINEGIPLDTTYTGKAYWGMKEYIKEKGLVGHNILFIHTGGTPLFFDKLEEL